MPAFYVAFYGECVAMGVFQWLGLYILSRGLALPICREQLKKLPPALSAGLGMTCMAWFVFGVAARFTAQTPDIYILWQRVTWWAVPMAIFLWFHTTLTISSRGRSRLSHSRWRWVAYRLVGVWGLVVMLVGTFTHLIFDYPAIYSADSLSAMPWLRPLRLPYFVSLGPAAWGYASYLIGVLLLCAGILRRQLPQLGDNGEAAHIVRSLVGSTLLFVLGGVVSLVSLYYPALPELLGHFIAAFGLWGVGQGVVRYNALMEGKWVRKDFFRSLRGTAGVTAMFLLAFHAIFALAGEQLPLLTVPLLVFLVVFTATPLRWYKWLINRLTLRQWETDFMLNLTLLQQEIMLMANEQMAIAHAEVRLADIAKKLGPAQLRETIEAEINRIFSYETFNDDQRLCDSPLMRLKIFRRFAATQSRPVLTSLSDKERADLLRHFLRDYVARLSPTPPGATAITVSDAWLEYAILRMKYLEGKSLRRVVKEIRQASGIQLPGRGGGVYYRYLSAGRSRLAQQVWEDEIAA